MSDPAPIQTPPGPTQSGGVSTIPAEPTPPSTADDDQKPDASLLGGDTPPPDAFDPEKLTLPEGFEAGEQFDEFKNIAKEIPGLTGPQAQKMVELAATAMKTNMDKLYGGWDKQQTDWVTEIKGDPEIGGAKLDEVKQTVSKVLDNAELSDPKFREALNLTGAGNNPAVVRTLYRWAQRLSEGGSVSGDPAARSKDGSLSNTRPGLAQAIYGQDGPHTGGPKL
jgi:hypothetical protein